MKVSVARLLILPAVLLAGCATRPLAPDAGLVGVDMLLDPAALGLAPVDVPVPELLAVSPEMRTFVDEHVDAEAAPATRWRQLAAAVTSADDLDLTYGDATLSAAEVFETRNGNCLSFSALLVALARYADLDARFREVDIPPDWTRRDGIMIRWRHINVQVDLGTQGQRLADFDSAGDTTGYPADIVADSRATAHFLNNLGVERMEAGQLAEAHAYFRRALEIDPRFMPAWNNLGALFGRRSLTRYAEGSFLHALDISPGDMTAMHNLVRLYEIDGDTDEAAAYRTRVERYRDRNPYYHYGLAVQALEDGDLALAEHRIRTAIRRKPDEQRFRELHQRILDAEALASDPDVGADTVASRIADAEADNLAAAGAAGALVAGIAD